MISPLSVDVHRDTLRLILNLRYVIQNAFHHVMVLVEDQPYLGFCWEHSCYELRVLPFGLAPSPLVFSKVVGVLVKHWRSKGIHVHAYLDDFLAGGFTEGSVHTPGHAPRCCYTITRFAGGHECRISFFGKEGLAYVGAFDSPLML